ncbi:DUF6763 family protein [Methylotetracoccus oryzae]|uniref:DUF6763 family protein n=1 Tax=Methylotetracoccus oryzae TaxID=1919059 RepID=UPI00111847DF|nr:DUF6763 family protein [Methylotetracoccus oryzae]
MVASSAQLENWYQDSATGRSFRVIAVDKATDSIEIQYFNGDLGEYDFASWAESGFSPIEAPEDWSGPFDDLELDDMGYSDPDSHRNRDFNLDDLLDAEDER